MPTIDERLRHVTLKIKRAKEHVQDLELRVRAFLDTNPYKVGTQRNPQTRQLIYHLTSVEATPDCLPLVAGDVLQNLMSALDHMAYQIVCSDTADNPPRPSRIYFPIADSSTEYESRKGGKIEGALKVTVDAIDAIKPYKGGNDLLWMLYRLNNIEKHRLLITVGSMFQSVNLGAYGVAKMQELIDADPAHPFYGRTVPVLDAFFRPTDVLFPLKVGDELFVDVPDAKVNEKLQFRFSVALYEPQIIEAQSLVETMHQLTTLVEGIVTALTPRLK
jgi:hypothetical protein